MRETYLKTILIIFLLLLQACTSQRVKETPNFNLTGADAKKEYGKFKLSRISIHNGNFGSEGEFKAASAEKLKPLVKDISPKAVQLIEDSKFKEVAYWGGGWVLPSAILFSLSRKGQSFQI